MTGNERVEDQGIKEREGTFQVRFGYLLLHIPLHQNKKQKTRRATINNNA